MLSDETERLVSAGSEAVRLPVCVYGTLRSGQAARDRLLDGEDIAAMAAARISDHRLMVASPDSAPWGGCAMAVPAAGESVVAELVVAERVHQRHKVVCDGCGVVAVPRLIGQPHTTLIDRDHLEVLGQRRHHQPPCIPGLGPAVN